MSKRLLLPALTIVIAIGQQAHADEGGVSFWLPGQYGSLVAPPPSPGWSFASIYFHPFGELEESEGLPRGGRIDLGVEGSGDLLVLAPSYTLEQRLLGGTATASVFVVGGRTDGSVSGSLTSAAGVTLSGQRSDSLTAFGDLIPQFAVSWNDGPNSFMAYTTANVPVGSYDPNRLVNLGIGHAALDVGGGYTYLNQENGREFSAVSGFTYNFENRDTDYQNGVDWHVDIGASQFLSERAHVGVVAYWFQQISGDSGAGAVLGSFKSRVGGIGPQAGFFFPVGDMQGYLNIKGYWEFAAENRPEGWNAWLTFALSPRSQ